MSKTQIRVTGGYGDDYFLPAEGTFAVDAIDLGSLFPFFTAPTMAIGIDHGALRKNTLLTGIERIAICDSIDFYNDGYANTLLTLDVAGPVALSTIYDAYFAGYILSIERTQLYNGFPSVNPDLAVYDRARDIVAALKAVVTPKTDIGGCLLSPSQGAGLKFKADTKTLLVEPYLTDLEHLARVDEQRRISELPKPMTTVQIAEGMLRDYSALIVITARTLSGVLPTENMADLKSLLPSLDEQTLELVSRYGSAAIAYPRRLKVDKPDNVVALFEPWTAAYGRLVADVPKDG